MKSLTGRRSICCPIYCSVGNKIREQVENQIITYLYLHCKIKVEDKTIHLYQFENQLKEDIYEKS